MTAPKSNPQMRIVLLRFLCAGVLLAATGFFLSSRNRASDDYEITVFSPSCDQKGYSLYTNTRTGETDIRDLVDPLGHSFSPWQESQAAAFPDPRMASRTCQVCGYEDTKAEYPELGITRVTVTGDLTHIGKTTEVPVTVTVSGEEAQIDCYALLKHQGHSSLVYDKKNYTLKLYQDPDRSTKNKLALLHWNPENKYILKANYMDPSQCRNLVCADIWADMVQSRGRIPSELLHLSNFGAVDGFPVALYINNSFAGLYTMNLHKDDDLFGMKDGLQQAIMIVNHTDGAEAFFREVPAFEAETPWEVEYCGTEDAAWAEEHLKELMEFVRISDDDTFRRHLKDYLDVDSAVDYLLAMYALGLTEHAAKDLVLVCYGPADPWICSMYDMEEAFTSGETMPEFTDGSWDSGTGSLLWDRMLNLFYPELCSRYAQLRQSILKPETVCESVDAYVAGIPQALYQADAAVNGTPEHTTAQTQQMKENIRQQILTMDRIFNKEGK